MEKLRKAVGRLPVPIVTQYSRKKADPFKILISTILSLRTKDATTAEASARLFELADTPAPMIALGAPCIARAIYPVGFYRIKSNNIVDICQTLIDRHAGQVPATLDALLEMKGVGRKTANLVLTLGFGKPGICVDTHVHRIVNRWGLLCTRNPEATEMALRDILPAKYWIPINDWLVAYGQQVCAPISPHCSRCNLMTWCARKGVERAR